jgi:hypothetical protein
MTTIDLHIHSFHSDDGEFSPEQLIDFCAAVNVNCISITDHNNVNALDRALDYCQEKEVRVITGIEIDCLYQGVLLHILGYEFDHKVTAYNELWANYSSQQQAASMKRVALVRNLGIEFSDERVESLAKWGIITGEVIAEAAMEYDKDKNNTILQPYYEGGARSDNPYVNFYWDLCSQGKPAFCPLEVISLENAIRTIHNSGGIAVLAHPGITIKENQEHLDDIAKCGINGIEVFSSYHNEDQTKFYYDYALKNNLIITCGSDFHGKTKPRVQIGGINYCTIENTILQYFSKL